MQQGDTCPGYNHVIMLKFIGMHLCVIFAEVGVGQVPLGLLSPSAAEISSVVAEGSKAQDLWSVISNGSLYAVLPNCAHPACSRAAVVPFTLLLAS